MEDLPKPQKDFPLPQADLPAPKKGLSAHIKNKSVLKSKFFIGFVLFFFLIAFIIGGFMLGDYKTQTNKDSDITDSWITYKEPGLSIKHPPTWNEFPGELQYKREHILINTAINYDISTGKPYSNYTQGLQNSEDYIAEKIKIDGNEEILYYNDEEIFLKILSKDKSRFYTFTYFASYFILEKIWKEKLSNIKTILSTIKLDDKSPILYSDWKKFENKNPNFSFMYPDWESERTTNDVKFYINISEEILKITIGNYKINYNNYPICDETKDLEFNGCVSELIKTTINNREANLFYLTHGVDSGRAIIQILNPKIEFDMFVAGGGLENQLQGILYTFKFTE